MSDKETIQKIQNLLENSDLKEGEYLEYSDFLYKMYRQVKEPAPRTPIIREPAPVAVPLPSVEIFDSPPPTNIEEYTDIHKKMISIIDYKDLTQVTKYLEYATNRAMLNQKNMLWITTLCGNLKYNIDTRDFKDITMKHYQIVKSYIRPPLTKDELMNDIKFLKGFIIQRVSNAKHTYYTEVMKYVMMTPVAMMESLSAEEKKIVYDFVADASNKISTDEFYRVYGHEILSIVSHPRRNRRILPEHQGI